MVNQRHDFSLLAELQRVREWFGGRPALEGQEDTLSHEEMHRRAEAFAGMLAGWGVSPGCLVGIWMRGSVDYVTVMLGTLKAGTIFMPLDTDVPPARLRTLLEQTAPALLVTDREGLPELEARIAAADAVGCPAPPVRVYEASSVFCPPGRGQTAAGPDSLECRYRQDPCSVFTTSGSTGTPKAILGSYRGLGHFIRWETSELELDETTRGSLLSPVTFDVSLRDIFAPLAVGGCVCIPPRETVRDPAALIDWLGERRVTLTHMVPTLFRLLTRSLEARSIQPPGFPHLRDVVLAGEASYGRDMDAWRRASACDARIISLYGPTETTLAKLCCRVEDSRIASTEMLPLGVPIADTEVLILADGRPCAVGEAGEIYIRTPYMSHGYVNDPWLTADRFVTNPLTKDPADRVYRTGDQGQWLEDGQVRFLGRLDGQVKLHGKRVDLGEIETRLREQDAVRQAAVTVLGDGGDGQRLVAYVVPEGQDRLCVQGLRQGLGQGLPAFMVPQSFVFLPFLPQTHSGKVDKKALPHPGRRRPELAVAYCPPKNAEEEMLCGIWSQILEIDEVGTEDGFFDLGGSSVLAMRVMALIGETLGRDLPVVRLFEFPTIRGLADCIGRREAQCLDFNALQDRAGRRRAMVAARKR